MMFTFCSQKKKEVYVYVLAFGVTRKLERDVRGKHTVCSSCDLKKNATTAEEHASCPVIAECL